MDFGLGFISFLIGYLSGSISFARILTKVLAPEADLGDLTIDMEDGQGQEPVGSYGANATAMILGPKIGLTVTALDMLKVILPMLVVKFLFPEYPYYLITSIGSLLGHNWPIYHKFRGGRGYAVIFGSLLVVQWYAILLTTLGGLFIGMVFFGSPMLCFFLWIWLMIPWMIYFGTSWELIYLIVVVLIFHLGTLPELIATIRLLRSGKYEAYVEALYDSSPPWQMMKKMADRLWILKPIFNRNKVNG
jgi:glycerol-3-phosphate acyltransferase PlsY